MTAGAGKAAGRTSAARAAAIVLVVSVLGLAVQGATPGTLEDAISLYQAAQYTEALAILEGLDRTADGPVQDGREQDAVAEYRALCLLALDRTIEAHEVIQALLERRPEYRPTSAELPPRYLAIVGDTRTELWPTLVRSAYRAGKASYDRKEYGEAQAHFRKVTVMFGDDSGVDPKLRESLADVRDLATGFLALIANALATPVSPVPLPPALAESSRLSSAAPATYTAADAGVTPPVAVRQDLPKWRMTGSEEQFLLGRRPKGRLEVLIDAAGRVEAAHLLAPLHPHYDSRLLAAAREWLYRPATRLGTPVRFRKVIDIQLVDPRQQPSP